MTEAILLILGLLLGAGIGLYVGIMRARGAAAAESTRIAGENAGLSATLTEVRGQLSTREAELAALRTVLETQQIAGAEATARLEAEQKNLADQRRQLEELDKKLKESFEALSAAALKSNNQQFVLLAEEKMKPLREQLARYEEQIKALEKARTEAYSGLSERVKALGERSDRLGQETSALVAALRQSGAKGRWGEVTLERIVELTGMTEHCDFEKQVSVAAEGGRQRPDLVIHLPGGRTLVVDSKVNTAAYFDAAKATEEADRKRLLEKYAGDVRNTLKALGGKEYWRQFSPAPALVVMFMPGEAFFAAAISQDWNLITDGLGMGVLPASPTTLIALLHAVQHGWQQQQMAENAEKIAAVGRELYERLCKFVEHFETLRGGLERAAQAYNEAVGNLSGRTLPSAKKLKELGAADAGREMIEPALLETPLRPLPPIPDE